MSATATEPVDAEVVDAQQPEPEQSEQAGQPEGPPQAEDIQQPAEADTGDDTSKALELSTLRGALALRPGQTSLDGIQMDALAPIGIDPKNDPKVIPHIRPFIHMCQVRGLDPWAKEAYLIGRGKDDNRKFTMQVAIDGYRKMAGATGKFIRVKKVLWTGADDDDRSYVQVRDEDGDLVMQRVWFDQWPESRGNPGAAKVVIEHYDDYGNVTSTPAIADWGMYAPYKEVWDYDPAKRKRAPVKGADGKTLMELNEMWAKGSAHMLSKCAEALCYRKAFPGAMAGVYTFEEMHRLDQAEQNRLAAEKREARQRAFQQHQQRQAVTTGAERPAAAQTVVVPAEQDTSGPLPMPVHVSETVAETIAEMSAPTEQPEAGEREREREQQPGGERGERSEREQPTDEQRRQWLRDEIGMLAQVLDRDVATLCQRQRRVSNRTPDQFTADDLWAVAKTLRPHGINALTRAKRTAEAEAYTTATQAQQVAPLDVLLGHAAAADDQPEQPTTDVPQGQPHAFVNHQGVCAVAWCEQFEDDVIHELPA